MYLCHYRGDPATLDGDYESEGSYDSDLEAENDAVSSSDDEEEASLATQGGTSEEDSDA